MKPPVALVRAYAYFLRLPLNERKRKSPPEHPITVYNRWRWGKDFETRRKRRPHAEWPDLIDFLGNEYDATLVWFGKRQVVQSVEMFGK